MMKLIQLIFILLFASNAFAQDYSKPDLQSSKSEFMTEMHDIINDVSRMDYSAATNIPEDAIRYNRTANQFEEYDGVSAWTTAPVGVPVGSVVQWLSATAPTGYLLLSGGTIGNASSGGTVRANADTSALFTFLWTNLANSEAAVSSGRGASAAADFAANKTIALPDMRQKFTIGKAASGTGSTLGGSGGNIDHTHTGPSHSHDLSNHTHGMTHTHDLSNHTHSTPAHSHASGTLRAAVGSNPGTNEYVFFSLDGTNTFTSTHRMTGAAAGITTQGTTTSSTVVNGSTANDGSGTSGIPSNNTSGAASASDTGGPSNNISGLAGTGATGTGNPPFLAMNFIIKY